MNKRMGFGFRGWMLTLAVALSYVVYVSFNNFPQNVVGPAYAEMYGWNPANISIAFTVGMFLCVIVQFIITNKVSSGHNVKKYSVTVGIISLVLAVICMLIKTQSVWTIFYVLFMLFCGLWATMLNGIIVGQWFPRRKGTVMGVATIAFPITTGVLLSIFQKLFAQFGTAIAFIPFIIIGIVAIILFVVFVADYPEQVGAFRDNDPSMTMEKAKEMMEAELEAKKHRVWTTKRVLTCRDFWFISIVEGFMMFTSVGIVVQMVPMMLALDPATFAAKGTIILMLYTVFSAAGSYIIGLLDTKIGTKPALLISVVIMALAGIFGLVGTMPTLIAALYMNAIFMGAGSNFMVSTSAEYWKKEEFSNVFGLTSAVSNAFNAAGPAAIAVIGLTLGYKMSWGVVAAMGIASIVLVICTSPKHIKKLDTMYRGGEAES